MSVTPSIAEDEEDDHDPVRRVLSSIGLSLAHGFCLYRNDAGRSIMTFLPPSANG